MQRIMKALMGGLLVLILGSTGAWAQGTAQISGTVRDESGAVLPSVEVTATQTETGLVRKTISNETGSYVLTSLPLGPYRLEAALPGFRTFVQQGIVLQVNSSPVINPVLQVGQVSEQIEVQANAALVETRTAGVGQVIERERILELPLNGRFVTDLITASGAAVQTSGTDGGNHNMQGGPSISVAGGLASGVQYSLDGAVHLDMFNGTTMPLPFPDALQEFRFVTSTQDATNGMHSGAAVNAVTKSGTNAFHGDLFEFLRNGALNGRDYFATKNDGLKRNQFGGTVGGPLKQDKLFFFAGYQGTTTRQTPISNTVFVPTPQMLAGDFTTFASPVCQNGRQITLGGGFVNNQINPASFSPAALRIAAQLPQALDACGRYLTGNILHENALQIPVRLDYQYNGKQTIFGRYMITKVDRTLPYDLSPRDVLTSSGLGMDDTAHSLTVGDTYVFGPNVVNAVRLFGNRMDLIRPGAKFFGPPDVGINIWTPFPKFLSVNVNGAFSVSGNANFSANSFSHSTNFGIHDDLSIVRGSHQFGFGGHYTRSIVYWIAHAFDVGAFTVTGQATGLGMSDFLLGRVGQLRQSRENDEDITQNFFGVYGQDTWKITPKLTMTYGVRWDPFFPMSFKNGWVYNFSLSKFYAGQKSTVISNAPPGFTYPGDPGFNGKAGIQNNWKNIDPRVGIAWDPNGDGKTAIRIAGGIAHDFVRQELHANTSQVSPFMLTLVSLGISLDNPYATYPGGNPFPYYFDRNKPVYGNYGTYLPVPPDMKTTTQYSWNLGIERQITPKLFASATYMGTQLIHVWTAIELNPGQYIPGTCVAGQYGLVAPGPCSTTGNVNQRRLLNLANPQANLGYMTQYDDGGTQNYNALLLNTTWNLSRTIKFNSNYTWSRCIGLPTITLLNPGQNYVHQAYQNNGPINRSLDVGNCNQDRRHIFNLTSVVQTPGFSGKTLKALASGWSLATIVGVRSGPPLNVFLGIDQALSGFAGNPPGTQRPNQVLASVYGDRNSLTNYLNPAAFATPTVGTYGNVGYNSIVGPRYWEWNEAISRQFRIGEQQRIEIRAEAFNVTNSFRPGLPGTVLGNPNTFGRILCSAANATSTNNGSGCNPGQGPGGPRIIQFALKYVF